MQGKLIVIDGITGSGKSTLIKAVRTHLEAKHRVIGTQQWFTENRRPPSFDDLKDADILFTQEPTRWWIGAGIREELSRTDSPYSVRTLAEAFALDRQIQYKTLILPALKAGKTIIQDRSVTSSLVLQPLMPGGPSVTELLALEGNAIALEHAPTDLILTHLDPAIALERLASRLYESKGVFEFKTLLEQSHQAFHSTWFAELFNGRGTNIHTINTNTSLEAMSSGMIELIDRLL